MAVRAREPERTCVGCRQVRPKAALTRLVRAADGSVVLDRSGSALGRGAYVCREPGCADRAVRRLGGALRATRVDAARIRDELTMVGAG